MKLNIFKKHRSDKPGGLGTAPTYSYYRGNTTQSKSDQPVKSRQRRDLGKTMRLAPSLIALLICFGAFFFNLYLSAKPVIKIEGRDVYRSTAEYEAGIEKIFKASISSRNKVTFNSRALEQKIIAEFPEVTKVTVAAPLVGQDPVVGLSFAETALRFVSAGKEMALDSSGKVLPLPDNNLQLVRVEDVSGIDYSPGDLALSSDDVAVIRFVAQEVKANQKEVESLRIGEAPRQLDLRFVGAGYFVKLSLEESIRQQMGALWAVLESVPTPTTYVDVRLGERAFIL